MAYENILVETRGRVGLITLNRPNALNALCRALIAEVSQALDAFMADDGVGAIVLTGSEKAFAAGADIKELLQMTATEAHELTFTEDWECISRCNKPTIAAVAGYALGGGLEVAMMCDILMVADTAKLGLPEITIGTIPGGGGTQRLTRAIGKSKAMEMCLTGRMMEAEEAERAGLACRVVPAAALVEEAVTLGAKIASLSLPVTRIAKEAVNAAYEMSLQSGRAFEHRLFNLTLATEDRAEGMTAFVEKRPAKWKHR
ncbi:MAG: enoyl-CoA hydratase/isomerase family protein [Alphaproteobacteria bacterium]|nr:enoyl-CoA hydratase/isomerase family protein [Alphaproteobacteria bacterium]